MKTTYASMLVAAFLLVLLIPLSLYAGGTPAGTVITNQAKMVYQNPGGTKDSVYSLVVNVTVDKKSGITITPTTRSVVVGDSTYVTYAATVTNTGNYKDLINFGAVSQQYAGNGVNIYKDADSNGVLSAGEISAGPITQTAVADSVAADHSFYIITRIFVTYGTVSNTKDTTSVTATLQYTGDGTKSAIQKDASIVSRVTFGTATKSVDNSNPQPGTNVVYTVKYLNTGTSNAQNVTLSDVLPSNVTWVSMVADSGGTVRHSNTSPDSVVFTTASIVAGRGVGFHFTSTIVNGTIAGTIINNTANLAYTDSINQHKLTTPAGPATLTVSEKLGWTLVIDTVNGSFPNHYVVDSTQSGLQLEYILKLTNNANRTDTAGITAFDNIPTNWTGWTAYFDKNGNASYDAGTDSAVTFPLNRAIAQNATVYYFVFATPGHTVADRTLDSTFYKAKSITRTNADSVWARTTVLAPNMQLIKNVTKVHGTARPGDTLEYVINYKNIGSGFAQSLVITDLVPTNTTYVPNTVATSPDNSTYTPLADASAGNPSVSGTVSVNQGTLGQGYWGAPANSKGYIKFRVTIN